MNLTSTRRFLLFIPVFLTSYLQVGAQKQRPEYSLPLPAVKAPAPAELRNTLANEALLFSENKGQLVDVTGKSRPDILFTARNGGTSIYLRATGIDYQFTRQEFPAGYETDPHAVTDREKQDALRRQVKTSTHHFSLTLEGANPAPLVRKELQNAFTENYYLGHCPEGITGVHTYGRLVYENVYPGIDWVVYSKGSGLKYDFVVHPGADHKKIRLVVKDADGVKLSRSGSLEMSTALGAVREAAPVSFVGGSKIASRFVQKGNTITFDVAGYPKSQTLTIDPSVVWSTYYGGPSYDYGLSCATDIAGNVFLAGFTASTTAIAAGGFQNTIDAGSDAYLVKFSPSGARLWATYYGGPGYDDAYFCATDPSGNVFLAGSAESTTGIASGGFQNTHASGDSYDAFLAKFNSNGIRQWATYYGGTGYDGSLNCTADGSGNVYLNGNTNSTTNIASGGHQNTFGGTGDAFLVKFDGAGNRLWATYYGGAGADDAAAAIADGSGNVYLTGSTASTAGISSNGFQNTLSGGKDAFLVKFSSGGVRQWGSYYGGAGEDLSRGCATEAGDVYVAGYTTSTTNIAAGGFQNTPGGAGDAFLVKFDAGGNRIWGTYYGGSSTDNGYSCTSDPYGNIFLIGYTISFSNIASGGIQNFHAGGVQDAYVIKFDGAGVRLWGTYFGGNSADLGYGCAINALGNVFVAGNTSSTTGIGNGGFQNTFGGPTTDAFLLKIQDPPPATVFTGMISGAPFCATSTLSVPFTTLGVFNFGNVYTAQLSNASGSFANPVAIGSITSTAASGNIPAIIPVGTPTGTGYRIRIVASNPAVNGTNNGFDITIGGTPAQPGPIAGNLAACTGSAQTYSITPVSGATSYTWTIPPSWSGNSTSNIINTVAGTSGGTISVTANNACGSSPASTINVTSGSTAPLAPSVTIAANSGFCAGQPVTFTATPVNGGPSPAFQWKRNGVNVGTNSATYTDPVSLTGTTISVEMISNAPCNSGTPVFSNVITEVVSPSVVPGININTIPPATLCSGSPITFISNITGGGINPKYKWYKNGLLLPDDSLANYVDPALQNGDTVQAFLISSEGCPVTQPTPSNKRGVTVLPVVQTALSINVTPGTSGLTLGTPVTFTAVFTGGGTTPVFTWKNNGSVIPGVTGPVYNTTFNGSVTGLRAGDVITVRMFSNDPCPSSAITESLPVTINPGTSVAGVAGTWNGSLRLFPNPAGNSFTIEGSWPASAKGTVVRIGIYNTIGQQVWSTQVSGSVTGFIAPVTMENTLSNGIYQVRIVAGNETGILPLVIRR